MSTSVQSAIVLAVVLVTAAAFVWRAVARHRRRAHGCGEACGCPSQKISRESSLRR